MRVILQADQRPKQNQKDEILPRHPPELYLLGKELGPMLNQENIQFPIMKCQQKLICLLRRGTLHRKDDGAIEFWRIKDNLQKHFSIFIIGLTKSGRKAWQETEATRKKSTL